MDGKQQQQKRPNVNAEPFQSITSPQPFPNTHTYIFLCISWVHPERLPEKLEFEIISRLFLLYFINRIAISNCLYTLHFILCVQHIQYNNDAKLIVQTYFHGSERPLLAATLPITFIIRCNKFDAIWLATNKTRMTGK